MLATKKMKRTLATIAAAALATIGVSTFTAKPAKAAGCEYRPITVPVCGYQWSCNAFGCIEHWSCTNQVVGSEWVCW